MTHTVGNIFYSISISVNTVNYKFVILTFGITEV